ncbi:hypothetical protein L838_5181 [Mycobacterium avium MAV_120709_2344]|nr:hypothetical protein L838_5181 [Mycobacterium avium MAV_120709_2344]
MGSIGARWMTASASSVSSRNTRSRSGAQTNSTLRSRQGCGSSAIPVTVCPAAISCPATSRPSAPVASVTRMCTWAHLPQPSALNNRQIGTGYATVGPVTVR